MDLLFAIRLKLSEIEAQKLSPEELEILAKKGRRKTKIETTIICIVSYIIPMVLLVVGSINAPSPSFLIVIPFLLLAWIFVFDRLMKDRKKRKGFANIQWAATMLMKNMEKDPAPKQTLIHLYTEKLLQMGFGEVQIIYIADDSDNLHMLFVDTNNRLFSYLSYQQGQVVFGKVYSFSEFLGYNIDEKLDTYTSSNSWSEVYCQYLNFQIMIDDSTMPTITFNLLTSTMFSKYKTDHKKYLQAQKQITHAKNAFDNLLSKHTQQIVDKAEEAAPSTNDLTMQLTALKKLYDEGLITEEEYALKKAILLDL